MNHSEASHVSTGPLETLRWILEKAQSPEELDDHPWAASPALRSIVDDLAQANGLRPGRRLLMAITRLFEDTMPSLPPRQGLRLDTRWGEFGLLAARYFAPLKFGIPFPTSLRDAWGRIDPAILLFVFGRDGGSRTPDELAKYRLVGNEQEVGAESTLSDWQRKGLQRLASVIQQRLSHVEHDRTVAGNPSLPLRNDRRRTVAPRIAVVASILLLLVGGILATARAYRVYVLADKVRGEVRALANALPSSPSAQAALEISGQLSSLSRDIGDLQAEARPFLWVGPLLRWVPTYGGDLAHAGDLLEVARGVTAAADRADLALTVFLQNSSSSSSTQFSLASVVQQLTQMQPELAGAQQEFSAAKAARQRINPDELSPRVRDVLVNTVDPAMGWLDDGLSISLALPAVLGAGPDGPKTYLLVVQNEDELRSTGGFITAVGKLVLDQGRVVDMTFEDSGSLDNWTMPYPMAPWQLEQFMNSSVLILRDANWFTDFPTAALYIKQLYAYAHKNSVDGVVAFDQHLLVMLLEAMGEVQVQGVNGSITAGNVIQYMRAAKEPPPGQPRPADWSDKAFVGPLAAAVVDKLLGSDAGELRSIALVLVQALEQRHLIAQFDTPEIESLLARRNWNDAVYSKGGDFLMVVDSNVGFNKTNAVVDAQLAYNVDLGNLSAPTSDLEVTHTNRASADVECIQWSVGQITEEGAYPIDRCYWDYMRVYAPEGTRLLKATPQTIPDTWMILNRHVVPAVDALDEGLPGLSSFGTLLVVPGGGTVTTDMSFALPAARILSKNEDGSLTYSLEVKKQPGTIAVPITIKIRLPAGASLETGPAGATLEGTTLSLSTTLTVDLHLQIRFR